MVPRSWKSQWLTFVCREYLWDIEMATHADIHTSLAHTHTKVAFCSSFLHLTTKSIKDLRLNFPALRAFPETNYYFSRYKTQRRKNANVTPCPWNHLLFWSSPLSALPSALITLNEFNWGCWGLPDVRDLESIGMQWHSVFVRHHSRLCVESQTGRSEEQHVSITIKQGSGVLMRLTNNADICLNFTEDINSGEQTYMADKLKRQ